MKHLLFLLLLFPIALLAQTPKDTVNVISNSSLIQVSSIKDTTRLFTIESKFKYMTAQQLRTWILSYTEKYIESEDASILATAVYDTLVKYQIVTYAFELTSGVGSAKGLQLPGNALVDSTDAGSIIILSVKDSSATYDVFVSSADANGLIVADTSATTYTMQAGETAIWQLYKFSDVYEWRLISSSISSSGGAVDLGVSRTGTSVDVTNSGGDDATIPAADASEAGVMTATQFTQLGRIDTLDQAYLWIGNTSNQPQQRQPSGDVSMDYLGAFTVDKIKNRSILNTAPTNGQVYAWSSSNSRWEPTSLVVQTDGSIDGDGSNANPLSVNTDSIAATLTILSYYEFTRGAAVISCIAGDTTGTSFTMSSGSCTLVIPSGVKWWTASIHGSDSNIPIQDFSVVVQTESTVQNQTSVATGKPFNCWIVAKNSTNTTPSGSSPWIYDEGSSPQRQIIGQDSGDIEIRYINLKNAFDYWIINISNQ